MFCHWRFGQKGQWNPKTRLIQSEKMLTVTQLFFRCGFGLTIRCLTASGLRLGESACLLSLTFSEGIIKIYSFLTFTTAPEMFCIVLFLFCFFFPRRALVHSCLVRAPLRHSQGSLEGWWAETPHLPCSE